MLVDEVLPDWHLSAGSHEHELIQISKKDSSDSVFVDVGAHVGTWSLNLPQFFRQVVVFDPNPDAHRSLLKNLEINQVNNVIAENMALWSNSATPLKLKLYHAPSRSTFLENHPIENEVGGKIGEVMVEAFSFDNYLRSSNKKIGVIKIDVEGSDVENGRDLETPCASLGHRSAYGKKYSID